MTASYRYHGGSPQHGRKTMPAMLSLDALDTRLSVPTRQLATPGPDAAQLQRMLQTAVRGMADHDLKPLMASGILRFSKEVALQACSRWPRLIRAIRSAMFPT